MRSAVAQLGRAQRKKVYVGLHQYGKSWYLRDSADDYVTVGKCDDRWVPDEADAVALSPTEAFRWPAPTASDRGSTGPREFTFTYTKTVNGHWYNSKDRRRNRECQVRKQVWFGVPRPRPAGCSWFGATASAASRCGTRVLDGRFFPAVRPYLPAKAANKNKKKPSGKKRTQRIIAAR